MASHLQVSGWKCENSLGRRPPNFSCFIRSENGSALTSSALRFRFEKARALAYKKSQEQGLISLAESIRNFQFRDLRAKAGTDKEEAFGMAAAKDQLEHANESMTQKYVRHRKGKIVSPTR